MTRWPKCLARSCEVAGKKATAFRGNATTWCQILTAARGTDSVKFIVKEPSAAWDRFGEGCRLLDHVSCDALKMIDEAHNSP
jgi:hypothetical protein